MTKRLLRITWPWCWWCLNWFIGPSVRLDDCCWSSVFFNALFRGIVNPFIDPRWLEHELTNLKRRGAPHPNNYEEMIRWWESGWEGAWTTSHLKVNGVKEQPLSFLLTRPPHEAPDGPMTPFFDLVILLFCSSSHSSSNYSSTSRAVVQECLTNFSFSHVCRFTQNLLTLSCLLSSAGRSFLRNTRRLVCNNTPNRSD